MAEKRSHANIPVFIPHLGCPNDCVFCDQRTISGKLGFDEASVKGMIDASLETMGDRPCEIAFFGGSFTGIDRDLMVRLLDTAQEYVDAGRAVGIRMSTRPDYITPEIIGIIRKYTLSEVELGVQSMSDSVLALSRRGHTSDDTRRACRLLREAGIPFGGQMMIGLPGAEACDEVETAREICRMGASSCRIYPAIVLRGTCLETMTERGEYLPLTIDEAVTRAASALEIFTEKGVTCLRIGLQDSDELRSPERYHSGPRHPAIGEMVRGEVLRRRIDEALSSLGEAAEADVFVPRGRISMAVGVSGRNRRYFAEKYESLKIKFKEDISLTGYEVRVIAHSTGENKKEASEACI